MTNDIKILASIFFTYLATAIYVFFYTDSFIDLVLFLVSLISSNPNVAIYLQDLILGQLSQVSATEAQAFLALCTFIFWAQVYLNRKDVTLFVSALVLMLFPVANLYMEPTWIRRFSFAVVILPSILVLWKNLSIMINYLEGEQSFQRILKGLSAVFLTVLIIPGFYLPPFYDGISGWYLESNEAKKYDITGTRIIFSDLSEVWFKPSFFSPITMDGRAYSIIKRRDPEFHAGKGFACMMTRLYSNAYPALLDGFMPWQSRLGIFGYPSHTVDRFDDRERYLAPDEIVGFKTVNISVDSDGVRRETEIATWNISQGSCDSSGV